MKRSLVVVRSTLLMMLAAVLLAPGKATAQQADGWQVDFIPFYFWAASTGGEMSAGSATVPFYLDFSQAKDNLGGAFTFHLEASKGRWGLLTDLSFLRLTSGADFTIGGQTVTGDIELENTIFEAGASYLVSEPSQFRVIGGVRTYSLAPTATFVVFDVTRTPVDASQTSANPFVGFTLRPQLSEKWRLLSRADIGAGDADLTWSAELGIGYRFKPWGGVAIGYKGLGMDLQKDDAVVKGYDVVQHGPFFGFNLHWGR